MSESDAERMLREQREWQAQRAAGQELRAPDRRSQAVGERNKHLFAFRQHHMIEGEEVVAWVGAIRDKKGFEGIAVLTDQRVGFVRDGFSSRKFELWPIKSVSSVEARRGMVFLDVVLHTSGDELCLRIGQQDRGQRFLEQLEAARHRPEAQAHTPPPAATSAPDALEQLERLARLRDAGAISADEFDAKKAELLTRI